MLRRSGILHTSAEYQIRKLSVFAKDLSGVKYAICNNNKNLIDENYFNHNFINSFLLEIIESSVNTMTASRWPITYHSSESEHLYTVGGRSVPQLCSPAEALGTTTAAAGYYQCLLRSNIDPALGVITLNASQAQQETCLLAGSASVKKFSLGCRSPINEETRRCL